jgi:hypothetical protein
MRTPHVQNIVWPLAALALALGAGGCSPIEVNCDYNPRFNFSSVKTFAWYRVPAKEMVVSQLTLQRIEDAVKNQMEAKGYRLVSENADFLVAIHAFVQNKVRVEDYGYAGGPYGWGPRDVEVYSYQEGTVMLDFVEAKSRELFWRGAAQGALARSRTPEQREERINEAVEKLLEKYPPK